MIDSISGGWSSGHFTYGGLAVVGDGRSIAHALDLGRLRDVRRDELHVVG